MSRFCILTLLTSSVCFGLVLHPGPGEPDLVVWTDRPEDDVVGKWYKYNSSDPNNPIFSASCVAVSSNAIITTRHQGGVVLSNIRLADVEYTVEEIINAPDNADLRLCRVKRTSPGATYLKYTPPYTEKDEENKEIIIGGFGKGRGYLISDVIGDGWSWANNHGVQRWGTNKILRNGCAIVNFSPYISDVIISKFDTFGTTPYEAATAEHDSGGGWFIEDNGEWKVAALSAYVLHSGVSYYAPATDQYGIRISSYADWISLNIPVRMDGDYSGDYSVDLLDFSILAGHWQRTDCAANNDCDGADFEPDGDVDIEDLIFFLNSLVDLTDDDASDLINSER